MSSFSVCLRMKSVTGPIQRSSGSLSPSSAMRAPWALSSQDAATMASRRTRPCSIVRGLFPAARRGRRCGACCSAARARRRRGRRDSVAASIAGADRRPAGSAPTWPRALRRGGARSSDRRLVELRGPRFHGGQDFARGMAAQFAARAVAGAKFGLLQVFEQRRRLLAPATCAGFTSGRARIGDAVDAAVDVVAQRVAGVVLHVADERRCASR